MFTLESVREDWDTKAQSWNEWVGEDGDENRVVASDPVLWRFVGKDIAGMTVLDAGCGTGYLSVKLAQQGTLRANQSRAQCVPHAQ